MLLYHYSVDSYQGGGELINDFKNNCRFAEPFLLALDKGGDCFWSVYFAAMSYSRELCALGLRKHENYAKDAVEGIFEWVRRRDFSADSASRVGCVYYCESKDEAITLRACFAMTRAFITGPSTRWSRSVISMR